VSWSATGTSGTVFDRFENRPNLLPELGAGDTVGFGIVEDMSRGLCVGYLDGLRVVCDGVGMG
jgi:hypothetical protein